MHEEKQEKEKSRPNKKKKNNQRAVLKPFSLRCGLFVQIIRKELSIRAKVSDELQCTVFQWNSAHIPVQKWHTDTDIASKPDLHVNRIDSRH